MKKFFNAIIVLIAFHSNSLISQEVEETVVVTSALLIRQKSQTLCML